HTWEKFNTYWLFNVYTIFTMLKIIDFENEKVIGMSIDGKIETGDIELVATLCEEKFKKNEKLSIYVEMESFNGISLEAFFKDLKFGIKNFGKFDKKAVVTDKSWIKKLGNFSDKLFGSIEIKSFSFEEKNEAQKWVSE
ncbi:MAG: STAS/SEC14 domain-containing protein, partial [Nitrospinota bacterium]